jgi:hypothetical protein
MSLSIQLVFLGLSVVSVDVVAPFDHPQFGVNQRTTRTKKIFASILRK